MLAKEWKSKMDVAEAYFEDAVTQIIAYHIPERNKRIASIAVLIECYVSLTGNTPDSSQLNRLSNYILKEELSDPNVYKIAHNEYPFLSEWQMKLRHDRETGLKAVEETGADGLNYRKPTRRRRSHFELMQIEFCKGPHV